MMYRLILLLLLPLSVFGQNFTHSGLIRTENDTPISNVLLKLFKRGQTLTLSNTMNVKIFSTQNGNGNTSK